MGDWLADVANGLALIAGIPTAVGLVLGVVFGFVVGVLPGLGSSTGVALALPLTLAFDTHTALLVIVGIYAGGAFAGAVPAILMNTPGEAGAAATAIDGYRMAQLGRAAEAIGVARMASVIGGSACGILVLLLMAPISEVALLVRTPEMALIAILALFVIGTVVGESPLRGLVSAGLGVLISTVSASPITAEPRLTFGVLELYESVPFLPVVVGLFAISEMMFLASKPPISSSLVGSEKEGATNARRGSVLRGLRVLVSQASSGVRTTLRYPRTLARSAGIGLGIGVLPGLGAGVATFISYGAARRGSQKPQEFGTGTPEGVVAAETADNAVSAGTLVPTLTLGVPGSSIGALMLAALYVHGVQPGPNLMQQNGDLAYAIVIGTILASLLIFPIGLALSTPLTLLTRVPPVHLVWPVMTLSVIGTFAARGSFFDVWLALLFGLLGVAMRIGGFPLAPLVIALVMGPLLEENLMRSLVLSDGSWTIFVESWLSGGLVALIAGLLLFRSGAHVRRRIASAATTTDTLNRKRR